MNQTNPLVHSGQDELKKKLQLCEIKLRNISIVYAFVTGCVTNKNGGQAPLQGSWACGASAHPTSLTHREKRVPSPHKLSEDEARELDQECYERFIKVNAKHITDGQVSGS